MARSFGRRLAPPAATRQADRTEEIRSLGRPACRCSRSQPSYRLGLEITQELAGSVPIQLQRESLEIPRCAMAHCTGFEQADAQELAPHRTMGAAWAGAASGRDRPAPDRSCGS